MNMLKTLVLAAVLAFASVPIATGSVNAAAVTPAIQACENGPAWGSAEAQALVADMASKGVILYAEKVNDAGFTTAIFDITASPDFASYVSEGIVFVVLIFDPNGCFYTDLAMTAQEVQDQFGVIKADPNI